MPVAERFQGKGVLITGTTGFLGKVLLQKILFSVSCVGKVWVLIRGKEGSDMQVRFKKEVIGSACFDRLRVIHRGRFDQFIQRKVQPINGDLQKEGLGLAPEILEDLLENCHVIINCAASIDFNARMDQAIDSNIRGSLRVLELARQMRNLCVFTHISTCYVNCDQRGRIKQEIIDKPTLAEEELRSLEEMPLAQLISQTRRILGSYPNTYTFTKSLCERVMKARQGNVPLCIVRPAIINTAYAEPFPGWIDSIAAAAAIFLLVGLGVLQELKGNPNVIGDTVPVDVVASTIIVATAYNFNNRSLPIYHVGSSDRNPMTWGEMSEEGSSYWDTHTTQYQVSRAKLLISDKQWLLNIRRWKRSALLEVYRRIGPLFNKQASKNAQRLQKAVARGQEVGEIFEFFIRNQWVFECNHLKDLMDFLAPAEHSEYLIDVAEIDVRKYIYITAQGLQKNILKQSIDLKANNLLNLTSNNSYFSDLKWALQTELKPTQCQTAQMHGKVLKFSQVLKAIETDVLRRMKEGMEEDKARLAAENEARRAVEELVCEVKPGVVRAMAWTVHKIFKNMFEQINVNKEMLEELRKIEQEGVPIVLLPTHRSYFDFLVISYIFFIYKMRLPHFIAGDSLLQVRVLPLLVRSSGAFFYRPLLYTKSGLYRVIFDKYLELLLEQDCTLGFYLEGNRSRSGKISPPQIQLLNAILDYVLFNKTSDACLVPITINYQKVIQDDTLPAELLGEERVAESLTRVLKASLSIRNNYGRVLVQISKPIMAKQYINDFCSKLPSLDREGPLFRRNLGDAMGLEVLQRLTDGIVVMSTAVVSSLLLMHRKGVNEDDLVRSVNEIAWLLLQKGYKVNRVSENSGAVTVNSVVSFLSGVTKSRRNIFELAINGRDGLQKIFILSYYRNTLLHAFLPDAFLACALASFGEHMSTGQGILFPRLHARTAFLARLLRNEHFLQQSFESPQQFAKLVQRMQEDQLLQLKGEKISVRPSGMRLLSFYCSLLQAPIECCWASLVHVISVARSEQRRQQASSLGKLFDKVQWLMQSMHRQKVIECLQACSVESIKAVFAVFQQDHLVRLTTSNKRLALMEVLVPTEQLEDLENSIKFFKNSAYSFVLSPLQATKSPPSFPKL